jgi:hypothetical protein
MADKDADVQGPVSGAAPAVPSKLTAEIGRTGARRLGGWVIEEFDPNLRGRRAVKTYDEMRRNDPDVALGLRAIEWVISQVEWRVEPGGEKGSDKKAAEFLESCMDDMSHTWRAFISRALECLAFGFAWHEVVYKVRHGTQGDPSSKFDDGRLGWRKIPLINPQTLWMWDFDKDGSINGMVQTTMEMNGEGNLVTIPISKSILFRAQMDGENPEGISLLRACYWPWYKKKNMEEIEAIGIERDLTGMLVVYLPVNATPVDHAKALDIVNNSRKDDMAGFVAPQFGPGEHERFRFEIISSPGTKSIDPATAINRYGQSIVRNFLAQFLMLGAGDTGSWALSRDHRGMFELALGAILSAISDTINLFLVPPLFKYNSFGQLTAIPTIVPGSIGEPEIDKFAKMISDLINSGGITPDATLEDYIREEMHLPEKEEPDPNTLPPQPPQPVVDENGNPILPQPTVDAQGNPIPPQPPVPQPGQKPPAPQPGQKPPVPQPGQKPPVPQPGQKPPAPAAPAPAPAPVKPEPGKQPPEAEPKKKTASEELGLSWDEEEGEGAPLEFAEEGEIDWGADEPQQVARRGLLRRLFANPKKPPLDVLRSKLDDLAWRMEEAAFDYKAGRISRTVWAGRFQANLKDAVDLGARYGQKRVDPTAKVLTPDTKQMSSAWLKEQRTFFEKLLDVDQTISAERLASRSVMYVQSAEGLYHRVVASGQEVGTWATWHLGHAEHCDDCQERSGKSWPTVAIPYVPGDGNSACLSNCRCYLTYEMRGTIRGPRG